MNKFLLFALSTFSVAAYAEPVAAEARPLSVSTFTVEGVSTKLFSFQSDDGRLCRDYVLDISVSADNKVTLTKATYCEGDEIPPPPLRGAA